MRRSFDINMPQMSMKGLSEAWLFKEIGDVHWSIITGALGVKSSKIADQNGNRLYATFISFGYQATKPLALFSENDRLDLATAMQRFGAGLFFANTLAKSESSELKINTASSFTKFGEVGNNMSLVKGQPSIPKDFAIASVSEKPAILMKYQSERAEGFENGIFHTRYEIVPIHDINGIGLLYFAAYPIITEICTSRYAHHTSDLSPLRREIKYFANSGLGQMLDFYIIRWSEGDMTVVCQAILVRPDGKLMAKVETEYAKVSAFVI